MPTKKLVLVSFIHAVCLAVYVAGISFVLNNGETIFGRTKFSFLAPFSFLMLFVFSAAVCGALVLGRPVMLFIENKKSESVKMFFYTIGWILLVMVLITIFILK